MYCFKHTKELLILQIEPHIASISTDYVYYEFYGHFFDPNHPEYDEETADGEMPQVMHIPPRTLIDLQTYYIIYENILPIYVIKNTHKYWSDLKIKYNFDVNEETPHHVYLLSRKQEDLEFNNIMQINLLIEYYNISNNNDQKYNNIYNLIFSTYFVCWFYILIISSITLSIASYVYLIYIIINVSFLFVLSGNYLYLLYLYKVNQILNNNKKNEEDIIKTFMERRDL